MLKLLDYAKLQNSILKCDQCKLPFDEYCQPKFLPCFKTICTKCEMTIHKETINKQFKCGVCEKYHFIPDDGFALNEKIYELISAECIEISRGENYEQFKQNLNKVESIVKLLWRNYENGIDIIKEHCNEQIRLIQLSTENKLHISNENKIEQIYKSSDNLIEFVEYYERQCIKSYLNKYQSLNKDINKMIKEANTFINEKQAYLKQYQIDDEEIKAFNKKSEDLQADLNKNLIKLKILTFDLKIIKFLPNTNKLNKFELGHFDVKYLREPSVFNFFVFLLLFDRRYI